jgi:hypothetical protein
MSSENCNPLAFGWPRAVAKSRVKPDGNGQPNGCLLRVDETAHGSHGARHVVDKGRQLLAQGSELQAVRPAQHQRRPE